MTAGMLFIGATLFGSRPMSWSGAWSRSRSSSGLGPYLVPDFGPGLNPFCSREPSLFKFLRALVGLRLLGDEISLL